jgi:hypothetical protein
MDAVGYRLFSICRDTHSEFPRPAVGLCEFIRLMRQIPVEAAIHVLDDPDIRRFLLVIANLSLEGFVNDVLVGVDLKIRLDTGQFTFSR